MSRVGSCWQAFPRPGTGPRRGRTGQVRGFCAAQRRRHHLPRRPGLRQVGEINAARAACAHPEIGRSRSGPALVALAHVYQGMNQHAESLALMDRARALGFDNADFRYFHAMQLQFHGRVAEAEAELEACLRHGPTYGRASLTLARLRKCHARRNQLEFIGSRLEPVEKGSEDEAAFEFARYSELEALGRNDDAWAALAPRQRGDARAPEAPGRDDEALFDAIIARAMGFTRMPAHR